jgi:hypothetical protein
MRCVKRSLALALAQTRKLPWRMRNPRVAIITAIAIGIFLLLAPGALAASLDVSRYPFRIPDWLWQDAHRTRTLSPSSKQQLDATLDLLKRIEDSPYEEEINQRADDLTAKLNSAFNVRDLAINGVIITDETTGLDLVLQFDPIFTYDQRAMLATAAKRFLSVALSSDVIAEAIARSSDAPVGAPTESDAPDQFRIFVQSRRQPPNADAFRVALKRVLSTTALGDPAVLVISAYSGNLWWGCGILNFNTYMRYKVGRDEAPEGFLSIALNTDKPRPTEPHWDDPSFWASKIAHEILHNIGYWHPNYLNPDERDRANSSDHDNAFIIAYENRILLHLPRSVAATSLPQLVQPVSSQPQQSAQPTLTRAIWIGDSLVRK